MRDYMYMFLEEISGLPLDREIEFIIELSPRITPLSQAPYRMALRELSELKEQLQVLVDNR